MIAAPPCSADPRAHPLRVGAPLPPHLARQYRLRAIFDCGKLDPQVADTSVLAPFPLLIHRSDWLDLASRAEALFHEALAAEHELAHRPELHRTLALPRAIRDALATCATRGSLASPRIVRLDFHWASHTPGAEPDWRVSEINADVPGGLIEAGALAALMHELSPHTHDHALREATPPPDPADALARALAHRLNSIEAPVVALVHATAFADDFQVMRRLAACLEARGVHALLAAPDHLVWDAAGVPHHYATDRPVSGIIRFFPAEWLPELTPSWVDALVPRRRAQWWGYLGWGNARVLVNPGTALLVQSKRWPLVWNRLRTPLPTWRALLPETRDPRDAATLRDAQHWVLKPALGRVGEGVLIPGLGIRDERAIRRAARRHHEHWIAQRPFHSVPVHTPDTPLHVCLGVYVIDGHAAGLYARASPRPLIDQGALELPVLIVPDAPTLCASLDPAMEAA